MFNQHHSMSFREMLFFTGKYVIILFLLMNNIVCNNLEDLDATAFLSKFGYLAPTSGKSGQMLSKKKISEAVKEYQEFNGLNITGISVARDLCSIKNNIKGSLNKETMELMHKPRCGIKDKFGFGPFSRSKRYTLQGSQWKTNKIKYRISRYPKSQRISKEDISNEIKRAFEMWSSVSPLKFVNSKDRKVHIDIKFEVGEHGCDDAFDGEDGTLAHAYYPKFGGMTHFDDAEEWTFNSDNGTNFFQVAVHELGHALGLDHSNVKAAVMYPTYLEYVPYFQLDEDDIMGIQEIYGKKEPVKKPDNSGTTKGSRKPTTGFGVKSTANFNGTEDKKLLDTTENEDKILCSNAKIDTIFSVQGITYVFKGPHYWVLSETAIEPGYPKLISDNWPDLPANIDAAFYFYHTQLTYFFKGKKYWVYNQDLQLQDESPILIREGFPGIPNSIDAAMVWGGNGMVYFFKGKKYWMFDWHSQTPIHSTYPKAISKWVGMPKKIDSAFTYKNGMSYFFKDELYYRFDNIKFQVSEANPRFPRQTGIYWFGCKSKSKNGSTEAQPNHGKLHEPQTANQFETNPFEPDEDNIQNEEKEDDTELKLLKERETHRKYIEEHLLILKSAKIALKGEILKLKELKKKYSSNISNFTYNDNSNLTTSRSTDGTEEGANKINSA